MQEVIKLLIGILVLVIGFPIGNLLTNVTKEELQKGQKWFKVIIIISLSSGLIGLILKQDVLMFSFFFIAIVTSRSLKR